MPRLEDFWIIMAKPSIKVSRFIFLHLIRLPANMFLSFMPTAVRWYSISFLSD